MRKYILRRKPYIRQWIIWAIADQSRSVRDPGFPPHFHRLRWRYEDEYPDSPAAVLWLYGPGSSAAPEMLCSRATARKYWRTLNSIVMPPDVVSVDRLYYMKRPYACQLWVDIWYRYLILNGDAVIIGLHTEKQSEKRTKQNETHSCLNWVKPAGCRLYRGCNSGFSDVCRSRKNVRRDEAVGTAPQKFTRGTSSVAKKDRLPWLSDLSHGRIEVTALLERST